MKMIVKSGIRIKLDKGEDSRITHTVDEGLGSIFGPEFGIVEWSSVPDDLDKE